MKRRYKYILSFLLAVLLAVPGFAHAVKIDLVPYAGAYLTQVIGFTEEEASRFIPEVQEDGSVICRDPDHPEWVYSVYIDRETSQVTGVSPFDTGYLQSPGEKAIRVLLRSVREKGLFTHWNKKAHQDLLQMMYDAEIMSSTSLVFAEDAGSAVYGLFESCYGPEFGWTDALRGLVQAVMDENHLSREPVPFHRKGIRRETVSHYSRPMDLTLFDGEIPEELAAAFSDPHLSGWECTGGAMLTGESPLDDSDSFYYDSGLAAFEKSGRRQLVMLIRNSNGWQLTPLGENALYRNGDYRITYDGLHESLAVEYQLGENERASFYLDPVMWLDQSAECIISAYEHLDSATGKAVWIRVFSGMEPTWKQELGSRESTAKALFPYHLGLVPVEQFPVTEEEADQSRYPGVPDQYALVYGPQFRTAATSHSRSYGELRHGAVIPVLDIRPGDPDEWIHTRLGTLEGYVVKGYTSIGGRISDMSSLPTFAEAKKEIALKRGTGWLDGSVGTFPAGTRMHVVFENGDWLYVDIPSGEMDWVMDPEGTFGYVLKNDAEEMSVSHLIEWPE